MARATCDRGQTKKNVEGARGAAIRGDLPGQRAARSAGPTNTVLDSGRQPLPAGDPLSACGAGGQRKAVGGGGKAVRGQGKGSGR